MYSKETIGNRLIKEGKWNGYYALSCCHLIPEPCPICGSEPTSTSHGYRTGCGNSECGQFLEFEDTWVWNRVAGQDLDAVHIGLEAE
jgi:hypothetical protein